MSARIATSNTTIISLSTHLGQPKTLLRTLLLVWLLGCLVLGCVATPQYQANDRLVTQMGVPKGRERLKEVLSRTLSPQVTEVVVTDEFFHYHFRQAVMGIPTGAVLEGKVFFAHAARIDVFENNVVNVHTAAAQLLAQLVFGSSEDARLFADLVASFHARQAGKS